MEQKPRRSRTYVGNAPGYDDWECVDVFLSEGIEWHLYRKFEKANEWDDYKLVADGAAETKANYWLGWNGKRTNRVNDWRTLEDNRPELHALVLKFLTQSA